MLVWTVSRDAVSVSSGTSAGESDVLDLRQREGVWASSRSEAGISVEYQALGDHQQAAFVTLGFPMKFNCEFGV